MTTSNTSNALIDGLKIAMLGNSDGGFIANEEEIPAGEMYRLAAEYIESVTYLDTDSDELLARVEAELAADGDPFTELEDAVPALLTALKNANAKIAILEAS